MKQGAGGGELERGQVVVTLVPAALHCQTHHRVSFHTGGSSKPGLRLTGPCTGHRIKPSTWLLQQGQQQAVHAMLAVLAQSHGPQGKSATCGARASQGAGSASLIHTTAAVACEHLAGAGQKKQSLFRAATSLSEAVYGIEFMGSATTCAAAPTAGLRLIPQSSSFSCLSSSSSSASAVPRCSDDPAWIKAEPRKR